ncbi:MAG: class I SAM-dependent methyltransferase [Parvibaculum sp.]
MTENTRKDVVCAVCGSRGVVVSAPSFDHFVSSDCRSWAGQVEFYECRDCSHIGKRTDKIWQDSVSRLYETYLIYHQADGAEQKVKDEHGAFRPRSEILVELLATEIDISVNGSALDVGAGNGAFLRALSKSRPHWTLSGNDLGTKHKKVIEEISDNSKFVEGDLFDLSDKYNFISLIHCLEHLFDPLAALKKIRTLLLEDGCLFLQVPNIARNAFDLLIFDHCSHFKRETLYHLLKRAGFGTVRVFDHWNLKELSIVAFVGEDAVEADGPVVGAENLDFLLGPQLTWLATVREQALARSQKCEGELGIFGSSISGTWVASLAQDSFDFFVDEDEARVGRRHLGKPIVSPNQVSRSAEVFFPFAAREAEVLQKRFAAQFHTTGPTE